MLFDVQSARYLLEVTKLLTTPQAPDVIDPIRPYLTNMCPECGEFVDIFDFIHAVVSAGADDGTKAYVVIGCERYQVINPQPGAEPTRYTHHLERLDQGRRRSP